MKGYIVGFKSRKSADHEIVDYWFSSSPKDAMRWTIREFVEVEVRHFNRGITINEDLGRPYMLTDFEIEEPEPGQFIVCAEGPFVVHGLGVAKSTHADTASDRSGSHLGDVPTPQ